MDEEEACREDLKRLQFDLSVARAGNEILAHAKARYKKRALEAECKLMNETFGAFHAVKQHLPHLRQGDPNVTVLVVGDGHMVPCDHIQHRDKPSKDKVW